MCGVYTGGTGRPDIPESRYVKDANKKKRFEKTRLARATQRQPRASGPAHALARRAVVTGVFGGG